jgi:hypothetical protein
MEGNLSRNSQLLEDTSQLLNACKVGKFGMLDEMHILLFVAKVADKLVKV